MGYYRDGLAAVGGELWAPGTTAVATPRSPRLRRHRSLPPCLAAPGRTDPGEVPLRQHSGDYSGSWSWEIAEGRYTPVVDEAGVEWIAWAELKHRTDEPFGPGPSILVPTDKGKLSVPSLCPLAPGLSLGGPWGVPARGRRGCRGEKWAKEEDKGPACAKEKSVRDVIG
eukprot:Skav234610  [mRNA]  locus=scaffold1110:345310:349611:- [translate_table: standard]